MLHALRLAARGLGQVWPNPAVGAVIVNGNQIVGTGVTARGGRPHAETQAIEQAGSDAKGATLYVTLEPCSHHGKTPPCVDAIIKAGVSHVVVSCGDSNPLVAGKGIAMLKAAGITVTEGVCEAEARALNEGFFSVIERGRPFVSVKIATSLDGRTVTTEAEGRWITGEASRLRGHYLRATHDAILTGIGTVLADDPELTCRLPGRAEDSPLRVLLDSALRIWPEARMLPAWIFTAEHVDAAKIKMLKSANCQLWQLPVVNGRIPLDKILKCLAEKGVTRLLVEGGKTLTEAFITQGFADRIYWFRAPEVVGTETSVVSMPARSATSVEQLGKDTLEIYECR
jgi:diaminohydroxyphosphoribosylaminopyrimidine deaminase/5-amino-6-(5-phosphoribosylamino)uracil reductase